MVNPALAQEFTGGEALGVAQLRHFHDMLIAGYRARHPQSVVLGRMRDVMKMIATGFENAKKPLKAICKARTEEAFLAATNQLFDTCTLSKNGPEDRPC